jgi:cobalamin biosynthesis protein CobD/CbiB
MAATLLSLLTARAMQLFIALALAMPLGWAATRLLRTELLVDTISRAALALGRKLNKRKRDAATLAWRGVIVTAAFVLPAMVLGAVIGAHWLLLLVIFAFALDAGPMLQRWRQAKAGKLPLSITRPNYLFPDQHGLLRYQILTHSRYFAVGVVGVAFWSLLLGGAGALGYLALALTASHYATEHDDNLAFGGVATRLFAGVDAVPRALCALLLVLAALFVPGSSPRRGMQHALASWPHFIASLLGIALGGPIPLARRHYQLPWVGTGTAKLEAPHLARWLAIWGVAWLMLLVLALPALISLST